MHSYVINFYVNNSEPTLARTNTTVMYPLEIIKVNGVKCGALLNTGSGKFLYLRISDQSTQNETNLERTQNNRNDNSNIKKFKIYTVESL